MPHHGLQDPAAHSDESDGAGECGNSAVSQISSRNPEQGHLGVDPGQGRRNPTGAKATRRLGGQLPLREGPAGDSS